MRYSRSGPARTPTPQRRQSAARLRRHPSTPRRPLLATGP